MAAQFDPYHTWLGIPPHEQPPNHYRLLGIPAFSSDPDIIENAADRQMAHLRTFQAGVHSDLSQKLLNEVAAARVCLFNAQKKADYDQKLGKQMLPPVAPLPVAPPPVFIPPVQQPSPGNSPEPQPEFDHCSPIVVSSGVSAVRKYRGKRKKASTKRTFVSIIGLIVFSVIGLLAGCFVLFIIYPQHPLIENIVGFVHDTGGSTPPPHPVREIQGGSSAASPSNLY